MNTLLTLLGSLSPLLTFAALWQVKEWRIDRLREHLRAEGWFRQLFGIVRPLMLLAWFIAYASIFRTWSQSMNTILMYVLLCFTGLTVVQIVLRRQHKPHWTAKAMTLCFMTGLLTVGVSFLLVPYPQIVPMLIIVQPVLFTGIWLLLQPLDRFLKHRIIQKAMRLRSSLESVTVIGITGSAGKTTTKELLAHILAALHPLSTPAHVNSEMGVAQWIKSHLSNADEQPRTLIVEMGAYRPGEIDLLCRIVQPTIGIVTFVGFQHIALFGSQEALCKAKGELIESLPEGGHAFLNADNEQCEALKDMANCPITTVGTGGHADIEAFDIEETPEGIRFRIGETVFSIPLHGSHNITNVLLAIAVARQMEMDDAQIAQGLKSFSPLKHTFNVRNENGITLLDDTHNASPASFKAAIGWAKGQPTESKILVTSGIIELGTDEDRIHTELGTLSSTVFDRVIFLSKRNTTAFEKGYSRKVELLNNKTQQCKQRSLAVFIGRMGEKTVQRFLPQE